MVVVPQKLTYQDFRNWEFDDSDDALYELINGQLVRKESVTIQHQSVSREIVLPIMDFAKETDAGEVLFGPLDVVLDEYNAFQPDIFFIKKGREFLCPDPEGVVIGAPDLVVEILSKSTMGLDKGDKKDNYEKYGVREYWLVDPRSKSVEVYALTGQRYKLVGYYEETGVLKSPVLEGFELDIESVFAE